MSDKTELREDAEPAVDESALASDSGDEVARLTAENEALKARLGELEKQCEDLKRQVQAGELNFSQADPNRTGRNAQSFHSACQLWISKTVLPLP